MAITGMLPETTATTPDDDDEDQVHGLGLDERVQKYLGDMLERGQRTLDPVDQDFASRLRFRDTRAQIDRAGMAGVAEGLSKLGTLGGKSSDVKPFTSTLANLNDADEQRQKQQQLGEQNQERQFNMNAKVLQYLQGQKYRSDVLNAQMAQRASDAQANRELKESIAGARGSDAAATRDLRSEIAKQHDDTMRFLGQGRMDLMQQKQDKADSKTEDRATAAITKRATALKRDLDPSAGRAGEFGKNQGRINAADRVLTLAINPDGSPRDLTRGEMTELASSVASMIANGSTAAQHTIDAMTPQSLWGDVEKQFQYLSNQPQGAGQQAFTQRLADTARREKKVSADQIRATQMQRITEYDDLRTGARDKFDRIVRGAGFDPEKFDDNLVYHESQQAPATAPSAAPSAAPGGAVAAPAKPAYQDGQTKVITGKGPDVDGTYQRMNGKWQRVGPAPASGGVPPMHSGD